MSSLYGFIRYNKRKKMTLAVYALTAFYRLTILIVPSTFQQRFWGKSGEESQMSESKSNYYYARIVSRYVNAVADRTPWESKCLVRALTARKLLVRKKISCTLYLGVGKDENGTMIAHSWLRCGEYYVTGGNGKDYAMVAKFAS